MLPEFGDPLQHLITEIAPVLPPRMISITLLFLSHPLFQHIQRIRPGTGTAFRLCHNDHHFPSGHRIILPPQVTDTGFLDEHKSPEGVSVRYPFSPSRVAKQADINVFSGPDGTIRSQSSQWAAISSCSVKRFCCVIPAHLLAASLVASGGLRFLSLESISILDRTPTALARFWVIVSSQ